MRYFEIVGGYRVPISAEEHLVLGMAETDGSVSDDTLDERQQEVARTMVRRGLLLPVKKDGKECLSPNHDPNIWRI